LERNSALSASLRIVEGLEEVDPSSAEDAEVWSPKTGTGKAVFTLVGYPLPKRQSLSWKSSAFVNAGI
jgi:hypothetical protein